MRNLQEIADKATTIILNRARKIYTTKREMLIYVNSLEYRDEALKLYQEMKKA